MEPRGLMEKRCCVCNVFIEFVTCASELDGKITSGYCQKCFDKEVEKLPELKLEPLEGD